MVYYFLHIAVILGLVYSEFYLNEKSKIRDSELNSFAVTILFAIIEAGLFLVVLLFKEKWLGALIQQIMRLMYVFDALFFISVCFGIIGMSGRLSGRVKTISTIVLTVFAVFLVYVKFTEINVSYVFGIRIKSDYLFSPAAQVYFPWTWATIYKAIFHVILPTLSYLILLLLVEKSSTQLEKFQHLILGSGILLFWISTLVEKFVGIANPSMDLLFMIPYMFLVTVIFQAYSKQNVPSGKGFWFAMLRYMLSYILPAFGVGALYSLFQPVHDSYTFLTMFILLVIGIAAIVWSLAMAELLNFNRRRYEADYENALEKELAVIDYSEGEMDQITNQVFQIIQKNIECSFMNVFIFENQSGFQLAYSSNNNGIKVSDNIEMFDEVLNLKRSVVLYSQLEKEHDLSVVKDKLEDFFKKTNSDALFILNEGHNIFGLITLGKKTNGDRYKEYDFNVFEKLYSYFFVFGYYMRNISKKDVLGTVNREIKMSSQVISSIQQNLDKIDNPKVDIGYLMEAAHNIGGEFVDFIRLTDSRYLFVVGDLSGKGIAASMNMVILKFIIRTYLANTHDFKQLVVKVNSFIRENFKKGTIFAGLFAYMDFDTDTMYYINCGVPALFLYTQVYNNVIEIQGSGHVLGFVKDISSYISVKSTKLSKGDILLACTDGLIQSHSLRGEQYGKERIKQTILENSTYPAQRMAQFTIENLEKFVSKELEDDVSILVLKYNTLEEEEEQVEEAVVESEVQDSIESEMIEQAAVIGEQIADSESEFEVSAMPEEEVTEEESMFTEVIDDSVSESTEATETQNISEDLPSMLDNSDVSSSGGFDGLDDLLSDVGL